MCSSDSSCTSLFAEETTVSMNSSSLIVVSIRDALYSLLSIRAFCWMMRRVSYRSSVFLKAANSGPFLPSLMRASISVGVSILKSRDKTESCGGYVVEYVRFSL